MQKFSYDHPLHIAREGITSPEVLVQGLLPAELVLERNEEVRMLSLLSTKKSHTLAQQRFTKNEWALLTHLLTSYPHYVPHEILLAELTSLSPDACRQHLQKVRMQGYHTVVQELKPVYRALAGVRAKLKKLYPNLNISLVRNVGYVLTMKAEIKEGHQSS